MATLSGLRVTQGLPMVADTQPYILVMIDHWCKGLSGEFATAGLPEDDLWEVGHEGLTGDKLRLLHPLPSRAGSLH